MKLSLATCEHKNIEKLNKYVYICKKCSTTKIVSKAQSDSSSKKPKELINAFIKPKEFNFNYEFNIPEFIRRIIKKERLNFISYKDSIQEKWNLYLKNNKKFSTPSTLNIDNSYSEFTEINENEGSDEEESDFESCNYESKYPIKKENLIPISLYYKYRNKIIKFLKDTCVYYKSTKSCLYLTLNYLDMLFKKINIQEISLYQMDLITNACFILAYKFIETFQIYEIDYSSFNTNLDKERNYIKRGDLITAEINCLEILDYNLNQASIYLNLY